MFLVEKLDYVRLVLYGVAWLLGWIVWQEAVSLDFSEFVLFLREIVSYN
jgi:hypothetical protein